MRKSFVFIPNLAVRSKAILSVCDRISSQDARSVQSSESDCEGFTLVELLVVIAIIGILIALLVPAVQAAREAARGTQCKNNLKQVGLAAQTHLDAQKTFPTGGWGYQWLGDPDRGFGINQTGGWGFTLLPFIEQSTIYNLGKGLTGASKQAALAQMSAQPAPFFTCPSRRAGTTGAVNAPDVPFNAPNAKIGARSDYAGNAGTYPGVTYTSGSVPPAGSDTNLSFKPANWFPTNLSWWKSSNGVILPPARSEYGRFPMVLLRRTYWVRNRCNRSVTTGQTRTWTIARAITVAFMKGTTRIRCAGLPASTAVAQFQLPHQQLAQQTILRHSRMQIIPIIDGE
jgi:prepilin-type N-terminal cleavage/methylation domain-containing protein